MVVLITLSLLGITIQHAVSRAAAQMREDLGGYFRLETLVNASESSQINDELINKIKTDKEIMDSNGINAFYLYSKDLQLEPGANQGAGNVQEHMPAFLGNSKSELYESFLTGAFELTEGRHIVPDDNGKVLISEALAKYNNLGIGDTISGEITEGIPSSNESSYGKAFEFEIVGIFKLNKTTPHSGNSSEADIPENFIFTDAQSAKDILSIMRGKKVENYNGGAYFFVKDPKTMEETMERIKQREDIHLDDFKVISNTKTYQDAAAPLTNMGKICIALLVIILVLSMVLLSLILMLWMRERMHEIGVLISIGITKSQLALQFLIENLLIMLLAFVLSYGIAQFSVTSIGKIVESSIAEQQEASLDELPETTIEKSEIKINTGSDEIISVLFAGMLITTGSVFISATAVFRLKPKQILSTMS